MRLFQLILLISTLSVSTSAHEGHDHDHAEDEADEILDRMPWWQRRAAIDIHNLGKPGSIKDDTSASSCEHFSEVVEEVKGYASTVDRIFESALNGDFKGKTYKDLAYFVDRFGPRTSGSDSLERAIDFMEGQFLENGLKGVHTENVTVDAWERGSEFAELLEPWRKILHIKGLGYSVPTPEEGIFAEVVVIKSFKDFHDRTKDVKGKIVVYSARGSELSSHALVGASLAAKHGAVAVLTKSVASFSLYTAHTGIQFYDDDHPKIPIAALTVEDAELIDRIYQRGEKIQIFLQMRSSEQDKISRNLIGNYPGREVEDEFVLVSGHIDSWDVGQGALDDGVGTILSLEVIQLLKSLDLRPRRTLKSILWTGEEIGLIGVQQWMKIPQNKDSIGQYQAVLEADYGCLQAWGLIFYGNDKFGCILREIARNHWGTYTNATGLAKNLHVYTDIYAFMRKGVPGAVLHGDGNSKYFWYHHTEADTMTPFKPKELDMCLALWSSLAYILADLKEKIGHLSAH